MSLLDLLGKKEWMFLPAKKSKKDSPRKEGPMSLRKLKRSLRRSPDWAREPAKLRKSTDSQWITAEEAASVYPEFGAPAVASIEATMEGQEPAKSKAPSSMAEATKVKPKSMTHIIMVVDKSESLRHLPDLGQEVRRVWAAANPEMAQFLAEDSTFGVPTYYIEANRYLSGTHDINPDHVLGPHMNELQVPEEHSVFVQLLTIKMGGREQEITLETVYRTDEPGCIVSEKPLVPDVG